MHEISPREREDEARFDSYDFDSKRYEAEDERHEQYLLAGEPREDA